MKLKFWVVLLFCILSAKQTEAADAGFRYINTRGTVRCGSELQSKTYAYKDESGYWRGIDADLCRLFSTAVFGRSDRFELVDVKPSQVNKAIATNKIDIMLGDAPGTASRDVSGKATQAELMYYARQMFLAQKIEDATSMEAYKGKKVCVVTNSEDYYNLQDYSDKYDLDLQPLFFADRARAKEAFLLKRCDLFTGNEIYLKSLYDQVNNDNMNLALLPEVIADKPIYAQIHKDNQKLRIAIKWIMNAVTLAEKKGINSKNIDIFIGVKDGSIKNLLGINPDLWNKFQLKPSWVKTAITELGNYGEIYERNLGSLSDFEIERGRNKLVEEGGLIKSQSFF